MSGEPLKAPFPWFGGKSRVADVVWDRFGADVGNYVEPFFGSGAVLLGRPGGPGRIETVNDLDGYIANFWRAVTQAPGEVAHWADWPVNEADLHARHTFLRRHSEDLLPRLMGDPDWCDPLIAGWWVWGMACWIGSGWCGDSGTGPWHVLDGQLTHIRDLSAGQGVARKRVHLGDAGVGVARQLVHLGNARGVARKLVHLGNAGRGVARQEVSGGLVEWMEALAARLERVRVCCGQWDRILGPSPTVTLGTTAVLLDPPYANEVRSEGMYRHDDGDVASDVLDWCIEHGNNPDLRIALCGYATETHGVLKTEHGWDEHAWSTSGGYSQQAKVVSENRHLERIWFSPACLPAEPPQPDLFSEAT